MFSPIKKIYNDTTGETYEFGKNGKAGKKSEELYKRLQGIQAGDYEDKYGWIEFVE